MKPFRGGLVATIMAGALVALPTTNPRLTRVVGRGPVDPKTIYSRADKEFWLSADEFGYTRPGFHITVNSVTINADRKAVVDISLTDDLGQPLDRAGKVTPGTISTSFILSKYDGGTHEYAAYTTRKQTSPITNVTATQAGTDSGGSYQDLDIGHAIYTFGTALPEGFDMTKTTTVGIYGTRDMLNVPGGNFPKNYFANAEHDFRPDGGAITEAWNLLSNEACNTCHNPLSAHGGARQDVHLCVLCHSDTTVAGTPNIDPDTGNTINFKVMIHKIHRGGNLPSVQAGGEYHIIGFQQGDNIYGGDPLKQVPDVVFPQDIRNRTTCHRADLAPGAVSWYTNPSAAACTSCHDDVNLTTGANHPPGPQPDGSCANCHRPQGDQEFDLSVMGAHTVPYKSTQLKGLNATIVSATNVAPGQTPTVVFALTENDGTPVAPSTFTTSSGGSNLNLLMGGPTTDYSIQPFRERGDHATFDGAKATYTFTHAIPADATGTWTFSLEARRDVPLNPAPPDGPTVREGAYNPVFYASVTGGDPDPRRMVVDMANCNKCHDRLALHGGQRFNWQECVICHNPNGDDSSQRPAAAGAPESIDVKRLIHRIHTGEELSVTDIDTEGNEVDCKANPQARGCFTIYGFNGSVNVFNDVRFPGDRRACQKCHAPDTQQVLETPPAGLLPTNTLRDWYSPQQHYATACLACHDSQAAAAHAFVMTAPFGEACATCHGPDAEFAVDKVHAQ